MKRYFYASAIKKGLACMADPASLRGNGSVEKSVKAWLIAVLVTVTGIALWTGPAFSAEAGSAAVPSAATVERSRHPRAQSYLKRTWGIEIEFVRQTAAGYMLEFRYRVIDADKAAPLFDRMSKPVLEHVESGAVLVVPTPAKTGALRNSNLPIAGRSYWMFFANPGKFVEQGEHVNIRIGKFEVTDLVVQ